MPSVLHRQPTLVGVHVASVALVAVGIAGHLGWVLEFFVDTGLSPLHAATNDLTARGQPHRDLFRTFEIVAGVAFLLAGPPLLRLAPVHWKARTTVVVVCVFGVLLLARAVFTLDCAASVSDICRQRTGVSKAHHVNFAASVLLSLLYVLGPLSLLLWWEGPWRVIPLAVVVLETLAWLAVVVLTSLGPRHFVGLAGRVQLLGVTVLLGVGAVYLLTTGRSVRMRWKERGE
ncbi:DUF998 domain-containing protein [Saccharomonospora sp. NPDC046836]|uniref:DUF998 domain-containing protein n=1 Tax=Saccharomonospora sp. NPDC046836 TaxID=3156921 RepID=UPI0033C2245A